MNIEKLLPLREKYMVECTDQMVKIQDVAFSVSRWYIAEFIGWVDGRWQLLVVDEGGQLELATQMPGFKRVFQTVPGTGPTPTAENKR